MSTFINPFWAISFKVSSILYLVITMVSCNKQTAVATNNLDKSNIQQPIGDTTSALGNNIMVIYQDKQDHYWFGSWETGLYRYDGKSIAHFTTQHGLPSNRVEEIKEDKLGNIYINTSKGVCRFDGKNLKALEPVQGTEWKLGADDIWFKNTSQAEQVFRFDGSNLFSLKIPRHPTFPQPFEIYSIYKDSKGCIWFGTNPLGACRYNGKTFDWISETDVTELHDGPANGVRSIMQDKDGLFWLNANYRYDVYGDQSAHKKSASSQMKYERIESIGSLDGKPNGTVGEYLSATKDDAENLWFATYRNGVWKYDGTHVTHFPMSGLVSEMHLFYIYKDNQGKLWLGTHENGVFKFNGERFERFTGR